MLTKEILSYKYGFTSTLKNNNEKKTLFLANYSELPAYDLPCFFTGKISNPYILARCLINLSDVVKSNFVLTAAQIEILRDPIVTVGNEQIRFEAFSRCVGVYARVDVTEKDQKDAFIASGTTNVDFNQDMISALGSIKKHSSFVLNVGSKSVEVTTDQQTVKEKKVKLPTRWIKSLTAVQHYLSISKPYATLNRLQAVQLFRSIPKGIVKADYFLIKRANKFTFSPVAQKNSLVIGGINRLSLLLPLLPLLSELKVFVSKDNQSSTWQLYFDTIVFSLTLSRGSFRGFSGEGTQLNELMSDISEEWLERLNNFSFANQTLVPSLLPMLINKGSKATSEMTSKLSAMGLLGYDLDKKSYFYRQLPFKTSRILTLNPRLKGAKKLLEKKQVKVTINNKERIEARVGGSGVEHLVIIKKDSAKCTCQWHSKYQNKRGECKHILAVKKIAK